MDKRPTLAESIAASVQAEAEDKGFWAFVPYHLIACIAVGAVIGWLMPAEFWSDAKWDVSTAVFGGLLAFNGILLALGWFAFSKIYEIISNNSLGKRLTQHGLLGVHLSFIDYNHIVFVTSALLTGCCLFFVLLEVPIWADRIALGGALSLTMYSLVKAISATSTMNELVWEQAHMADATSPALRTVGGNDNSS